MLPRASEPPPASVRDIIPIFSPLMKPGTNACTCSGVPAWKMVAGQLPACWLLQQAKRTSSLAISSRMTTDAR